MATVIPALSTRVARMTQGERRVAERLEQELGDDDLNRSRARDSILPSNPIASFTVWPAPAKP